MKRRMLKKKNEHIEKIFKWCFEKMCANEYSNLDESGQFLVKYSLPKLLQESETKIVLNRSKRHCPRLFPLGTRKHVQQHTFLSIHPWGAVLAPFHLVIKPRLSVPREMVAQWKLRNHFKVWDRKNLKTETSAWYW